MFKLFKKEQPIEKFWTWFSENEKALHRFQEDPDRYLHELLSMVRKIGAGLAIELEPPKEGVINMTISADGVADLFPMVQQIVDKAPRLSGWRIVAFRQRMPIALVKGMVLKAPDHELNPNTMKFSPIAGSDGLDIIIFVDTLSEKNYHQVAYGGLLLLDNLLGEFDCVTKVRAYDFHPMPPDASQLQDLFPLLELAEYVDNFHKKKQFH